MNHLEICILGSIQSLTFMPLDPKPLDHSTLIYAFIRPSPPTLALSFWRLVLEWKIPWSLRFSLCREKIIKSQVQP